MSGADEHAQNFEPAVTGLFVGHLLSARTVGLAAIAGAMCLYLIVEDTLPPETNAWDLPLIALTDTKFLSTFVILWWILGLISLGSQNNRDVAKIRYGSAAAVVKSSLWMSIPQLTAGILAVTVVAVSVSIPLGLDVGWSKDTLSQLEEPASILAFSSAQLGLFLPLPVVGAVASIFFTSVSMLLLASCYFCSLQLTNPRLVSGALIAVYFWAALCSFGMAERIPALDISSFLSLSWALHQHTLPVVFAIWLVMSLFCLTMMHSLRSEPRQPVRTVLTGSLGMILLGTYVAVSAIFLSLSFDTFDAAARSFFSGSFGSIIEYAHVMLIVFGFATTMYARLVERGRFNYFEEALRYGSHRRWLISTLGRFVVLVVLGSIIILVAAIFGIGLSGGLQMLPAAGDIPLLAYLLVVLFLQLICYAVLAVSVYWFSLSIVGWPVVLAICLVLGYPFILALGPFNVFAALSVPPEAVAAGVPHIAPALSAAALSLILLIACMVRAKSHPPRSVIYF